MNKPSIINQDFDKYLSKLEKYNSMMEGFLTTEFYKAKSDWNFEKEINKENLSEIKKTIFSIHEHTNIFPQSFRSSLLVQIYSVFEKELKDICLYHHETYKTDFSIKDLKGNSDVEKAKLYLKKSCGIDFNKLNPDWEFINNIRKIRNLIVHSRGEITRAHNDWNSIFSFVKSNKDLIGFFKAIEYLEKEQFDNLFDNDRFFIIEIQDSNLIIEFIIKLRTFFRNLILELDFE